MITPEYLAGLIDGEGYLALLPTRKKESKNVTYEPVIKIGMTGQTAYEIMYALKDQYAGNVQQKGTLTKGGRVCYTIVIKSRKLVSQIVADIYPYLIVKKEQAKLLLEFCDLPMTHPRHFNFDSVAAARKAEIYQELKDLKKPELLAETN